MLEKFARGWPNVGHTRKNAAGARHVAAPAFEGNTELRKFRSRGTRLRFWSPPLRQPGTQRFRLLPRCGDEPACVSCLAYAYGQRVQHVMRATSWTKPGIVGAPTPRHCSRQFRICLRRPRCSSRPDGGEVSRFSCMQLFGVFGSATYAEPTSDSHCRRCSCYEACKYRGYRGEHPAPDAVHSDDSYLAMYFEQLQVRSTITNRVYIGFTRCLINVGLFCWCYQGSNR